MGITTPMGDHAQTTSLLRLVTWLSPAFPVGAFSYSGGVEQAVHDDLIKDAPGLAAWLRVLIVHGAGWNDAVLLAESYRVHADPEKLEGVRELAEAMAGSLERHRETTLQGEAFLAAAMPWLTIPHAGLSGAVAYPVAVGAVAGLCSTGLEPALAAYLHATVSNLVSVAIRCGVTGQKDGVAVLATLEPSIADRAAKAASSTVDDLGSASILADISALRHETLHSRLFRS